MNRTPPADIQRVLREETGFLCAIKECKIPYLEYHHFDPPWHIKNHHDPKGMIALCGYSIDVDPHSSHIDPSVDFGLKKIGCDKITVFF